MGPAPGAALRTLHTFGLARVGNSTVPRIEKNPLRLSQRVFRFCLAEARCTLAPLSLLLWRVGLTDYSNRPSRPLPHPARRFRSVRSHALDMPTCRSLRSNIKKTGIATQTVPQCRQHVEATQVSQSSKLIAPVPCRLENCGSRARSEASHAALSCGHMRTSHRHAVGC